jgi:hypothetical protein
MLVFVVYEMKNVGVSHSLALEKELPLGFISGRFYCWR